MVENSIAGRYVLQEELGRGGMGVVYRATDRLTDTVLALKRVSKSAENLQFKTRVGAKDFDIALANEFQQLASLRHPNIINVLDYGFTEQQAFFTMTYLPNAQTITEVGKRTTFQGKISLLLQLLRALAYLHRRGIIHRDLKPENALVTPDKRVYVLDFGLADEQPQGAQDGTVMGTLICIAPEVLQGQAASASSDLYAVGLIAYEIFTGSYPFDTEQPSKLIYDIIQKEPDYDLLDLEEGLQDVIKRLLDKSPSQRPTSAHEVIHAIQSAVQLPLDDEEESNRDSFLQAARFIGREIEMATLEEALIALKERKGSAWLIGGESGVGKSRLINELRTRAMVDGALVLVGQGVLGGGLPFQLWREPLRRLLLSMAISDLDTSILKEIVPDMERLLQRPIPDAPMIEADLAPRRLMTTILAVFAASEQPLVLLLEDLHWLDESLNVLKQLCEMLSQRPILILGTYRSDERPNLPQELPQMNFMPLERLSENEIARLSESMLGEVGREAHVIDLLQKETEGNIYFIVETVRALAEEAGRLSNVGRMTLPPTVYSGGVQKVIERRLNQLPSIHRPLLNLAAVAGRQVDPRLIEHMATIKVDEWFTACVNSAIFTIQDGVYQFAHDKLREAVIQSLSERARKELHRQVAQALETVYPTEEALWKVLADHWHNAHNLHKEAHYAHLTGKQFRQTQMSISKTYLHRALELLGAGDVRYTESLWMLGRIYFHTTDYEQAEKYLQQARQLAEQENDTPNLLQALDALCGLLTRQNKYAPAREIASEALDLARSTKDIAMLSRQLNNLGGILLEESNYKDAQAYFQESLQFALEIDDKTAISLNNNNMGILAYRQGQTERARSYFEKVLKLRREMGVRHSIAGSLNNLGVIAATQGDFKQAFAYHDESYRIKNEIGDQYGMSNSLNNLGIACMQMGDYPKAEQYFRDALALCQEIGNELGISDNLNNLGLILRRQGGNLNEALHYLEQAAEKAVELSDRLGYALALTNIADIHIELGQIDLAQTRLKTALADTLETQAMQPTLRAIMWYAQIFRAIGQTAHAVTLLSFVNLHPSVDGETRGDSERMLLALTDLFSTETLVQAIEASKDLELESLAYDLLAYPPIL